MILIDRVSHMTSACGVIETVDTAEEKPYFEKEDVKIGGYIFEEFYFNLENAMMTKANTADKTYHVGDLVPLDGDSFKYPEYFDIVSLESQGAVLIRGGQIQEIVKLEDYRFTGLPVLDERGFALIIKNQKDLETLLKEYEQTDRKNISEFHNKWFRFETYRKIVCTDNFWMI